MIGENGSAQSTLAVGSTLLGGCYLRDECPHKAAGGNQFRALGVPRSEECFAGRVDKGDVRQIKANG